MLFLGKTMTQTVLFDESTLTTTKTTTTKRPANIVTYRVEIGSSQTIEVDEGDVVEVLCKKSSDNVSSYFQNFTNCTNF
jgi:hypothetical protein